MQLILDCIKLQRERGFTSKRKPLLKGKSDAENLQEAAELLRALISECIDKDLPIDFAFAHLHKTQLTNEKPDYQKVIDNYRSGVSNQPTKFRQKNQGLTLLKEIELEFRNRKQ